MAKAFLAQYH